MDCTHLVSVCSFGDGIWDGLYFAVLQDTVEEDCIAISDYVEWSNYNNNNSSSDSQEDTTSDSLESLALENVNMINAEFIEPHQYETEVDIFFHQIYFKKTPKC